MTKLETLDNQLIKNYAEKNEIQKRMIRIKMKNHLESEGIKLNLLESARYKLNGKYFSSKFNLYKIINVLQIIDDTDHIPCLILNVTDNRIARTTAYHYITDLEITNTEFDTAYTNTLIFLNQSK